MDALATAASTTNSKQIRTRRPRSKGLPARPQNLGLRPSRRPTSFTTTTSSSQGTRLDPSDDVTRDAAAASSGVFSGPSPFVRRVVRQVRIRFRIRTIEFVGGKSSSPLRFATG